MSKRRGELAGPVRRRTALADHAKNFLLMGAAELVPLGVRRDHSVVRHGSRCAGVHLIIDLYEAKHLDDLAYIEATLRRCVDASRATLLHLHLHRFQPNGVSGVAVLAESHISIHTWPYSGYAALDVFMCGNANPDACVPVLREAFSPKRVAVSEMLRGQGL
jgi:S-adenosylmethionine decarboxylase